MKIKNILLIVIIIVLLYIVVQYIIKDKTTLTQTTSAKTMQKVEASSLATNSSTGNSSNFAYSIWFFIDDWNYRYGESKIIFGRMGSTAGAGELEPCPSVTLAPLQNNAVISLACYNGSDEANSNYTIFNNCGITNVPIQKWANLTISVYGRSLDVYLDGKLVRTCVMPGVAKIDASAPVYVTPEGGFSGYTAKFQYYPNELDPQTAWNIYQKGYGASLLGNMFNYKIKISLMEGDTEDSSITI
jgi:uncharacterized protein (UPF0333 family)